MNNGDNMNLCGISEEYLAAALEFGNAFDMPDIYRLIIKLISEHNYEKAKEIIIANEISLSEGNFSYHILDSAVEHCLNIIIDNNGIETDKIKAGMNDLRPTKKTYNFIDWLLKNGANPNLPANFNQIEHILDLQQDCSEQCSCTFDCSEILSLLKQYA